MMRAIEIYFYYFLQFFKSRLEYKADFFASIFSNLIVTAIGILSIVLLIDGKTVSDLKGWTRPEIIFIYAYSIISSSFFYIFAPNLYRFADRYIIQGQFDRVLLRPLSTLAQVLFESFNLDTLGSLVFAFFLIRYSASSLSLEFSLFDYFWFFISGLSGGIIILSTFVTISSLSFHFDDRFGIASPFFRVLSFARYPMPIYNRLIQAVLIWVLPFSFVAFYPATHFLGKQEFAYYCYATPFVALATSLLALFAWSFGVARYKSTGS